ncbi:MAG: DNA repair protein RadC [Bacteroidales bacterium]|nr:DNA repair protein RadC [Bacteroidales bacterium]
MEQRDKSFNFDSEKKRLSIKEWDISDRPREKLMNFGRTSLSNAELLAIIIGSGNTKQTAVDLAKEIMNSVDNSLHELSKLSYKEFCNRFDGIGPAKALNIIAALELGFRRKESEMLQKPKITCSKDAYTVFAQYMLDLEYETFWIALLDIKGKVLKTLCISQGGWNETSVDVRKIFKAALEYNAASIILAHNHPSGETKASRSDIETTKNIIKAGRLMSIKVLDHIIIGNRTYLSMNDSDMVAF